MRLLAAAIVIALAGVGGPYTPPEGCYKIEWEGDELTWVADQDYESVTIKAGTEQYVFTDVNAGDLLEVPKGISHIIFCEGSTTSSTTTTTSSTSTSTSSTTSSTTSTSTTSTTTTTGPA